MSPIAILYAVYAAVIILGGVFGFVKSKSAASLISGAASGIVMIVATLALPHSPRVALGLGTLVSVVLLRVFARRYAATRKAMPAIPLIVISIGILVYSLAQLLMPPAHHA